MLEFIDSCAHSGSGSNQIPLSRKYTSYSEAQYVTTPSRVAGVAIAITNVINKTLSYQTNRIIGCAYYIPSSSSGATIMGFGSGGITLAYLKVESDFTVSMRSGGTNEIIWNSGIDHLVVTADVYHYYEFGIVLTGTAPIEFTGTLYVDGQEWTSGQVGSTGINQNQLIVGVATMNGISFSGASGGGSTGYVCDIYVLNGATVDLNGNTATCITFLGDVSIIERMPVQDVTIQWGVVGGSGPYSYTRVNEIPPDDDTTYVNSDTLNQADTFLFQPILGFTGTLLGAQLLLYAKKDAEGTRTIEGIVGDTAQNNNNGLQQYLYDYYDYFIFPLDSDNGTPWTPAIYNAENFGVFLSA